MQSSHRQTCLRQGGKMRTFIANFIAVLVFMFFLGLYIFLRPGFMRYFIRGDPSSKETLLYFIAFALVGAPVIAGFLTLRDAILPRDIRRRTGRNRHQGRIEDARCPKCGAPMRIRTARRGRHRGQQFGRSRYPTCKVCDPVGAGRLPDAPARLTALTEHERTLLVEAGAGSGKTALMAGRVALLIAAGIEPEK